MPDQVAAIDPHEAAHRIAGPEPGALLVDVREPNEFAERRIPGALPMPLSRLAEDYQQLPTDRPIITQCASGKRSLVAAEFLSRHGYAEVSNLEGGIIAWQAAGLPTDDQSPAE